MRTCEGKTEAIYLDHAGNVEKHGFPEFIVPESLHDGLQEYSESSLVKKDKDEIMPSVCPQCFQHFLITCACGYQRPPKETLKTDDQELKELKKVNKEVSGEEKSKWLGEFQLYARKKGYKPGWASWAYRAKFGVWPSKITPAHVESVSPSVKNHITHLNIRKAKRVKRHLA
jgi:hypothetical protein